tara:strand:+ start:243 stop:593 length:351 start_codon:yes stop_codon:yes gene_type:complete
MRNIILFLVTLLLAGCSSSGLVKTDKKDLYTSNTTVIFDNEKKLFKYEFSINNNSKETITNFAYSVVFANDKEVAINTFDKYYEGSIEPKKAGRAFVYIDDFVRKNFKSTKVFLKK